MVLVAMCLAASGGCGGTNPDDLFGSRDAAADGRQPIDVSADVAFDRAPTSSGDAERTVDASLDAVETLADAASDASLEGRAVVPDAPADRQLTDVLVRDVVVRDVLAPDVVAAEGGAADVAVPDGAADAEVSAADASPPDASSCDDGNPCTTDTRQPDATCSHVPVLCAPLDDCHGAAVCSPSSGRCAAPALPLGAVCASAQGGRCDAASVCTPTFMVVRVGDGTPLLAGRSAAVFLERRYLDKSGTLVTEPGNPVALPVAAIGNNLPCTLSASGATEGSLSLSADGRYVTLAGYLAPPGTFAVRSTNNRVVARVGPGNAVDTTTLLTIGLYGDAVRGATTLDGSQFWVAGAGNFGSSGIYYLTLGEFGGTAVLANPAEVRSVHVFQKQLYASTRATVVAVGAGASDAADQITTPLLPGNADPYSFALIDNDAAIPGVDTAYVANDRAPDSGGGIAKWRKAPSGAWRLVTTYGSGLENGVHGLGAIVRGGVVTLIATTSEPSENHLVAFTDDGTDHPFTILDSAHLDTIFRGVAFAP